MQTADAKFNRSSLLLAVRRYSSAVRDMEQTVLLPSLLRDVPSEDAWDCDAARVTVPDLYGHYVMLKAVRNTVEGGLSHSDDQKNKKTLKKSLEGLLDTDAETLFRFHLNGLLSVMGDLTQKTQSLTDKYLEIIGVSN